MSDIKKILSDEMRRLARKEIKAEVEPLVKKILELRKTVSALSKELKASKVAAVKRTPAVEEPNNASIQVKRVSKTKLDASAIRRIRERLGVSQMVFGKLIGASLLSVSHWELGNSVPRAIFKERILSLKNVGKRELKKLLSEKNIAFSSSRARRSKNTEEDDDASSAELGK